MGDLLSCLKSHPDNGKTTLKWLGAPCMPLYLFCSCFQAAGGECSQGHQLFVQEEAPWGRSAWTVSPASADLQMTSLMDHDQPNTLCGFINSSLREIRHYFFVLSLFLAKFRCCVHIPLASCFWCCGTWEEDIQLLVLGSAEVWTLNEGLPSTGKAGVWGSHSHVPAQSVLCVKRSTVFQSYCFASWLRLSELPYRLHAHMRWVSSPWGQWELFYWLQSRAFGTACDELGLSPKST